MRHPISGRLVQRGSAWLAGVLALLLVVGGGAAAAARFDASRRTVMLEGVRIGGIPLGGLNFHSARARLVERFESPLDRPIEVELDSVRVSVTPRELGARSDALERFAEATRLHGSMSFPRRTWHRLTGRSVGQSLEVQTKLEGTGVETFLDSLARRLDRTATNAAPQVVDGALKISEERAGFATDKRASIRRLREALASGETLVRLMGKRLTPSLTKESFADILVVKVGENKLEHYRGELLIKTYGVATGSPDFPTPLGVFKIVSKRKDPTWVNPAKFPGGWGWELPERIGPGPGNPLGTRALDLSAKAIRIHGTYAGYSIGYNASHGCIRMLIAESEELFDFVKVGTPVLVVETGPFRLLPKRLQEAEVGPRAENDATQIPGQVAPASPASGTTPSPAPSRGPAPTAPTPAPIPTGPAG